MEKAKGLIRRHEGLKLKPYHCTAGKLTIGYGRNLEDKGVNEAEAEYMLSNDVWESVLDLYRIFGDNEFKGFSPDLRAALTDMRFQLGPGGFRGFKNMIEALKRGDIAEAKIHAADSGWFKQTPDRAKEIIGMF
jgi:lysozyme